MKDYMCGEELVLTDLRNEIVFKEEDYEEDACEEEYYDEEPIENIEDTEGDEILY
ncbi:hypothetical protein [Mitsuokella sp. WILCCON 0060]|uniref:hypothetical protein n=1 Tax=unclassified Mitsuokella TaxID=2637239 RepID=UPI003F08790E